MPVLKVSLASDLWQPSNLLKALVGRNVIMILISFFTVQWELGRRMADCWAAIRGSGSDLAHKTRWTESLNSTCCPPLFPAFTSPLWLYFTCCKSLVCTVCALLRTLLGDTAQWFLSLRGGLHSDAFQTHEMFSCFLLNLVEILVENSGYGYTTKRAKKQRSDLLTFDQTDADLRQAQQEFGYLKRTSQWCKTGPYQLNRTYWLILEIYGQNYFIYCISFFYFNKLYILKIKFLKQCFRRVFHPLYLYLFNRKEEGNHR